jgi:hypothetical protein
MGVGQRRVDDSKVHGHDTQALALVATQNLTDQAATDGVGLDEDESALGHGQMLLADILPGRIREL